MQVQYNVYFSCFKSKFKGSRRFSHLLLADSTKMLVLNLSVKQILARGGLGVEDGSVLSPAAQING